MRLQARRDLVYAGREWAPGTLFDAYHDDALRLINQDLAHPFGLEDPSTRLIEDILRTMQPPTLPFEPPPDVPATVAIDPSEAEWAADGGEGSFEVAITGTGSSLGWTAATEAGADWLIVRSPPPGQPQTENGTVAYMVLVSKRLVPRRAVIHVNNADFTVTQRTENQPVHHERKNR